ncbi:sensor domain-containing phosphodiesterase [Aurantiacibacter flavus]|uniref:EAL domain-containing protein n=1 Tax=Aurantiacibacter flavus TaxID=3145232 RepID=A0ABV0CTW1_9SPHN
MRGTLRLVTNPIPFPDNALAMPYPLSAISERPLAPASAIRRHQPVNDESVGRILKAVREHLGTEIAFVSRYVENHEKELTHVDSDLDLPMGPGYRDSRDDSYCWHIAQGRLPELIQDPADHPFARTLAITEFLPVGCHLNVPLKLSDGTIYGSFCCLSRKPDRTMTTRDLGVLKSFAALAVEQIERTLESGERRAVLEGAVSDLLASGSLQIMHQPIVAMDTGQPVGAECLARFPDAHKRGPDKWFAEANEVGRGVELELLAIRSALATADYLPRTAYVSINASPETIMTGAVEELLAPHGDRKLVVEVTEHQQVADFCALKDKLAGLSAHARIAIDDVGAGYSGLRHLVDLAPDLLKLDMSLTRDIHRDVARQALTTAMVHFARQIGSKLVAEGVECEEERAMLAALGVDYGQGFLFARPMPVVASSQFFVEAAQPPPLPDN